MVLLLGLTAAISCSAGTFSQLLTLLVAGHIGTQATGMRMTRFQTCLLPSEYHRDILPGHCLVIKVWDRSTNIHVWVTSPDIKGTASQSVLYTCNQVQSAEKTQSNRRHLRALTGLLKLCLQNKFRPALTGSHFELADVQQLVGTEWDLSPVPKR